MIRVVLESNREIVAEVDVPDDCPDVVVWRGRIFSYNSASRRDYAYDECTVYTVLEP